VLANLSPRFAVSGHWESFFTPRTQLVPLPLLDLERYVQRAETALSAPPDAPMYVDGAADPGRHVLVHPGMDMYVPSPP